MGPVSFVYKGTQRYCEGEGSVELRCCSVVSITQRKAGAGKVCCCRSAVVAAVLVLLLLLVQRLGTRSTLFLNAKSFPLSTL